jgi:hypothetical protein
MRSTGSHSSRYAADACTGWIFANGTGKTWAITEAEVEKTNDPDMEYLSLDKLRIIHKALTVCVNVGGIMLPTFLLFLVLSSRTAMFMIVLVFVSAFSIMLSASTDVADIQFFGTVT